MSSRINNFLRGFGSLFDLWPAPRRVVKRRLRPRKPDTAIADAWQDVGDAMRAAMQDFERETGVRGERHPEPAGDAVTPVRPPRCDTANGRRREEHVGV